MSCLFIFAPWARPCRRRDRSCWGRFAGARGGVLPVILLATALFSSATAAPFHWCAGGGFLDGGIVGEYFDNADLAGAPAFSRRDVRIDFDWGDVLRPGGSISASFQRVGTDAYSIRWTGWLKTRFSELYTLKVQCDDGARLSVRVAGAPAWTELLDAWSQPGTHTVPYGFLAGVVYEIQLEYRELTGPAQVRLLWLSPSTPEEVIQAATSLGMAAPHGEMMFANTFIGGSNHAENYPTSSTDPKKDGVLTRDAAGWPTEDFSFLVRPNDSRQLAGTYLLKFTGRADVSTTVSTGVFKSIDGTTDFGNTLTASTGTEGYTNGTTTALCSLMFRLRQGVLVPNAELKYIQQQYSDFKNGGVDKIHEI